MEFRRVLAVIAVLALSVGALSTAAQKNDNKNQPKRSKAEQQDLDALLRYVDGSMAGQPAAPDLHLTWKANHFIRTQDGATLVPFTLDVDPALRGKDVAYYVRVVEKGAALPAPPPADPKNKDLKNAPPMPSYPWNTITFTRVAEDGQMARAVQLKPGEYDAFIAIKEKGVEVKDPSKAPPPKIAFVKHELSVPDFSKAELSTSSFLLAANVEMLPTAPTQAQIEQNPYIFGPLRLTLSLDGKLAKTSEPELFFWVYGVGEAAPGKPDVQIEFSIYQKLPDGEKVIARYQPQLLNAQTLPPDFSLAAGHSVTGNLPLKPAAMAAGEYRIEAKVTDKTNNKTITQNVAFTVTA